MAKSENTRVIKASRQSVWNVLTDMEGWIEWGPNKRNKVIRHKILEQYDNIVICDEIEQTAGFFKTQHIDKYILHPIDKIEEVIVEGDLEGGFEMFLSDHPNGTLVFVKTDVSAKNFFLKIIDFVIGKRLLHKFWDDFLEQLETKINS